MIIENNRKKRAVINESDKEKAIIRPRDRRVAILNKVRAENEGGKS